jgi:thiamine pyrophosphate-dependent acetolactate synthase large subunit-like protein
MNKLSMKEVQELVAEAPGMIRKLASERDFYRDRYEAMVRHENAEKTAAAMIHKGLSEDDFETLTARLEKAAEQGKLEQIQVAVDMVGPDMGTKLAQLTNDDQYSTAGTAFEQFIVSGLG